MSMAGTSEWRLEDLHEYGLAAELESMPSNLTGLGHDGEAYNMRWSWGVDQYSVRVDIVSYHSQPN